MNPKKPTPKHVIIKMKKVKDNKSILNAEREFSCKGAPIRLSIDFSTQTLQDRREWQEIFKVMKSKDLQPRLVHPARLSII